MDSIVLLKNLTIFPILNLILTFQDYRTAYIYVTALTNDDSFKIFDLAWNHMVPIYLIDLDKKDAYVRSKIEEPTLNVFAIQDTSDIYKLTKVKKFLEPNDITLILFNSPQSNVDQARFQPWMKLSTKVLIIWKTFLISVNQCKIDQIDKISIHPYNETATKQFVKDYLADFKNAQGAKMTIFLHHIPPKSWIGGCSNNYTFNGPDGVISDVLFKALNVTSMLVTDLGILFPYFDQWYKKDIMTAHLHYFGYHKEATTTNLITRFNVTANSTMDFHMTAQFVEDDETSIVSNPNTERLYPHDSSCLIMIVPMQPHVHNFLPTVIKNGDIQSIICALLVFALARCAVQRARWNEWFSVTFRTLQFSLNQGLIFNRNKFEAAWTNILRGFSVIAISTMSAIFYKSLIYVSPSQIDTIADLIASNFTVFVPESLSSQFDELTTNLELRNALVTVNDEKFGLDFLKGEPNSAYVFHEDYAQFYIKMKKGLEKAYVQSHIMKEKLYCRLNSYRINKSSPFKRITNDIVMRCFENGLYQKVHHWAIRLNNAILMIKEVNAREHDEVVRDMEVIANVLYYYLAGMFTSLFVLFLEICLRMLTFTTVPHKIQKIF